MSDARHEHMNRYIEQQRSLDPVCMRCGAPADWSLQGVGLFQRMHWPETLCQRCLKGVDPVHVPVFSEPPAEIPLRRWPHEAHKPVGKGSRLWLGFQVHLAILTGENVLQNNQFVDTQFVNRPDVFLYVIEGMGRQVVDELRGCSDTAPGA